LWKKAVEKVRGGRNRKEKVGDEKKKPIEFSLKSPRCTLNTPHLTSPDWEKKWSSRKQKS
jgi:hypothetical protein